MRGRGPWNVGGVLWGKDGVEIVSARGLGEMRLLHEGVLGTGRADEFGSGHQGSAFERSRSATWQDEALFLTLFTLHTHPPPGICSHGTQHTLHLSRELEGFPEVFLPALLCIL